MIPGPTNVDRSAVVICGPTASGKSALAMGLAEALRGTIINADSMQVYRELAILTARPSLEQMRAIPHRLYGVLGAAEPCSAARWRELALAEIAAARSAARVPILVGGTGLYLRSLLDGIADLPPIPPEIRAEAVGRHAAIGGAGLRADLMAVDPATACHLPDGDTQRLIRAWEVWRATGIPLSAWQRATPPTPAEGSFRILLLLPPRAHLYRACDDRFAAMVAAGAIGEVQALEKLGLSEQVPARKAVGVPELRAYLAGAVDLDTAIRAGQRATRHYAKRQVTWFRHQVAARYRHRPDRPCLIWHGNYCDHATHYSCAILPELLSFILRYH